MINCYYNIGVNEKENYYMEHNNAETMIILESGDLNANFLSVLATVEDKDLLDDIIAVLPDFVKRRIPLSLDEAISFVHEKHIRDLLDSKKEYIKREFEKRMRSR